MNTTDATTIEWTDEAGTIARQAITARKLVIGRLDTADLCLPGAGVSRSHAELSRDRAGRWRLRDLGSHNGTWVAGARIHECEVTADTEITIGGYTLKLITPSRVAAMAESSSQPMMTITRSDTQRLSSLDEGPPPRVRGDHLAQVTATGRQLLDLESPDNRRTALCRLMLEEPLPGRSAMVFRLVADAEPIPLTDAQHREDDVTPTHVSRTLLDAVLDQRVPLIASNAGPSDDAIELSIAARDGVMAAAACPLHDAEPGEPLDVLYVTLPSDYGGTEWLALIALAVEQYRYAESAWTQRREAVRMAAIERELEQARALQMSFVPKLDGELGMDIAIVFEPCLWVGGDYVDVLRRPDGELLLIVGDVCGKGIRAALTTASLHTMIHAGASANLPLAAIINNLNDYLCEMLPGNQFVTMTAIEIDPTTGDLTSVNAGHPPTVVTDDAGNMRLLESAEHFPLGIDPQRLQSTEHRLEPGEWLAMFSDGLTELPVADGKLWNIDGVAAAVRDAAATADPGTSAAVAAAITRRSERLLAGQHAPDDRTLLLARRHRES